MLTARYGAQTSHDAWSGWSHPQQQQEDGQDAREAASSRPLLTNHDANESHVQEETDDEADERGEGGRNSRRQYYGAIEDGTVTTSSSEPGPRLGPSRLNSEREVWRDE